MSSAAGVGSEIRIGGCCCSPADIRLAESHRYHTRRQATRRNTHQEEGRPDIAFVSWPVMAPRMRSACSRSGCADEGMARHDAVTAVVLSPGAARHLDQDVRVFLWRSGPEAEPPARKKVSIIPLPLISREPRGSNVKWFCSA